MDDSCAVCADNLEWVAYGPCNHRVVCSTCVVRLRFLSDDIRCCICKSDCNYVFVTKALGDYTKVIDFSTLPSQVKEGSVGSSLWYHEDTQAYFDDVDHYKMIKAMCRLSCTVCDNEVEEEKDGGDGRGAGYRRRQRFRNIGQLKGHLSHQHKLFMCDLCLEGRKVFICEQKLYTRTQLNQHKRTGDSEVDGTEHERGGFAGHPMCEFCRTYFYGENELYCHMSTDHYTCHICQRRHPGQFEYYKDYDDLESHFRHDHFLCEDESCLAKKFIVFQTTEELKRHETLEHGGRMSRSKRSTVLQIPTSFRYRSNTESGYHHGRRRSFRREPSQDSELNMAIQASLDSARRSDAVPDPSSSSVAATSVHNREPDIDPLVQPFELLSTTESESSSRYRQAVSHISSGAPLQESSFPPLASSPSTQQRLQTQNTMAARLRRQNNANVVNVARPRQAPLTIRPAMSTSMPQPAATVPAARAATPAAASWRGSAAPAQQLAPPTPVPQLASTTATPWPALITSSGSAQIKSAAPNGPGSSSYASYATRSTGGGSKLNHSTSVPNLMESRSYDHVSDFPPISRVQPKPSGGQTIAAEDIQTMNKVLVERIRGSLDYDENKYSAFKEISQKYRLDLINTWTYLEYVKQFELTHLVPDMARLCPDIRKQKELLDAYSAINQSNGSQEIFRDSGYPNAKGSSSSKKDKGKKMVDSENRQSKDTLAESVISTVRSLQSQLKPSEEVEVLEKDGYRASSGKSTIAVGERPVELHGSGQPMPATGSTTGQISLNGGGGSKPKKKTSKFHRNRLGEESPAAILDVSSSNTDASSAETSGWPSQSERLPVRGAWGKGGGHKLFAK